ncbi:hypothetical protein FALBO_12104 [Fusarium albosuccineum]|uniref:Stress-response A/B barrel domain-containing protein n=1 Tax=Fusarium albosuccineum TaxID=1237068 RepID=A0A8H4L3T0_9HYPO|nr:hypothetical protein FALBO_12104 [Fusarium albosuccineum]
MPFFVIVAPDVPAESKERFLGAWPTLKEELKAQPGVAGVSAGPVVAENGAAFTDFKFIQCIAFKTADDLESFESSAWSKERKERYNERVGGEPVTGKFEVANFPDDASPKKFTQFSTIVLDDKSKHPEARKAWMDLASALGKETWGGVSTGGEPTVGLGLIAWDSLEEAGAAYKDPKAAAAFAEYQSIGKVKNTMVQME